MFDERVALVTGSARGIGRAVAEVLAAGGARVVIADLDRDAAEQAADEIAGETTVWGGDLTDPDAPESLIGTAISSWGKLDIVVNNAGYTLDAPIHKMSEADFQAMLDIHATVPFRVIKAVAPYMREAAKQERKENREVFRKIVNVSSVSAYGNPGQANYSTAKAGVIGLTKTVAREWGAFKINVNAVAFGFIETRLTAAKGEETVIDIAGRSVQVGVPEQMLANLGGLIALGRAGTPQEAAGGVAFLCSPWSDYVTGQVLNVSGGILAGLSS